MADAAFPDALRAPAAGPSPEAIGMSPVIAPAAIAPGRILRDPLTLFILAGGAIFALFSISSSGDPVVYTTAIERALVEEQEALSGRPATDADRDRFKARYVADELLFREAIETGEHLTDSVTRKRLTDKMRFAAAGTPQEPTEAAMVNYYAENLDRYRSEPRISFEHVFFSEKPAIPGAVLLELQQGKRISGDDFWVGRDFPRYGESMVRGIFGQPFTKALQAMPEGQWTGPIESPRGWHFVRKTEMQAPAIIPYADIREQVGRDMMMASTIVALDMEVARLTEKYGVKDAR